MDPLILSDIKSLLNADDKQVGQTYRLMESGINLTKDLVNAGVGGNTGVVNTNKQIIRSITEGSVPRMYMEIRLKIQHFTELSELKIS